MFCAFDWGTTDVWHEPCQINTQESALVQAAAKRKIAIRDSSAKSGYKAGVYGMPDTLIIARAHRGEPKMLVAVENRNRLIYAASLRTAESVRNGELPSVGFPEEDVFLYDSTVYETLRAQWESAGKTDPVVWRGLRRLVN